MTALASNRGLSDSRQSRRGKRGILWQYWEGQWAWAMAVVFCTAASGHRGSLWQCPLVAQLQPVAATHSLATRSGLWVALKSKFVGARPPLGSCKFPSGFVEMGSLGQSARAKEQMAAKEWCLVLQIRMHTG